MTTPGAQKLDGNPAWPWRPTELYRPVTDSRQRATKRTAGPKPGLPWDTVSTLDEVTCVAEDYSVVYMDPDLPAGQNDFTSSDLAIENYKMNKRILAALAAKA